MGGGLYAPLTWLSHMVDCQVFGMWAGGHHLTNILIHITSTLLLLLFLIRVTGARWRSLLVAALFALHPLHVESVAWVAERKDVLSGFFFVLTLLAYEAYARKPGWLKYAAVFVFFVLGLLSKAMLVTLPFLILLLDYWPLGRLPGAMAPRDAGWPPPSRRVSTGPWSLVILEKVPLLALSLFFSWLTAQDQPIIGLDRMPLAARLMNLAIAYGHYTLQTFIPYHLAVFYPIDFRAITLGRALAWGLPVAGITLLAIWLWRKRPYVTVGWLWFMGLLVPVIGLVQVGAQARADRYTYLPSIGLFIVIAWGLEDLVTIRPWMRKLGLTVLIIWLVALTAVTVRQVGTWHDTLTLFSRDFAVTKDNARSARYVGKSLAEEDKTAEAVPYYRDALRVVPAFSAARLELAQILVDGKQYGEAADVLFKGMMLSPFDTDLETAFLKVCSVIPDPKEREQRMSRAVLLHPNSYALNLALGRVLVIGGSPGRAVKVLKRAVGLKPKDPKGWCFLGHAFFQAKLDRPAAAAFHSALEINPHDPNALAGLAWVLLKSREPSLRDAPAALRLAKEAVRWGGKENSYFSEVLAAAKAGQPASAGNPK